ncbi:hypothetical protein T492DRAFT_1020401 [Pavlovales sp. CCMP2436]|nr:hypothetical protein T492DRAFT_1020401 [Pavlovales sp. CCMP2436]
MGWCVICGLFGPADAQGVMQLKSQAVGDTVRVLVSGGMVTGLHSTVPPTLQVGWRPGHVLDNEWRAVNLKDTGLNISSFYSMGRWNP